MGSRNLGIVISQRKGMASSTHMNTLHRRIDEAEIIDTPKDNLETHQELRWAQPTMNPQKHQASLQSLLHKDS